MIVLSSVLKNKVSFSFNSHIYLTFSINFENSTFLSVKNLILVSATMNFECGCLSKITGILFGFLDINF